jgi:hypothetical protein
LLRWIIATLVFLAIGWIDLRYGHWPALATLIVVLVFIAIFGGHGPRRGVADDAPEPDATSSDTRAP